MSLEQLINQAEQYLLDNPATYYSTFTGVAEDDDPMVAEGTVQSGDLYYNIAFFKNEDEATSAVAQGSGASLSEAYRDALGQLGVLEGGQ